MLRLAREWVWDFWFADDGRLFHVYYLKAPRSLADPGLRHRHATIGHGTSQHLVHWSPWEACPPLNGAEAGFWHLEVPQVEVVDGRAVLLFSGARYVADGVGALGSRRCSPGRSDRARASMPEPPLYQVIPHCYSIVSVF